MRTLSLGVYCVFKTTFFSNLDLFRKFHKKMNMDRVPKMARRKIFLARGIHCCLSYFFLYFTRPASLYYDECTQISAYGLYMNYRYYQIILRVKHFDTNRQGREVLTRLLSLGRRPSGDWAHTLHWTNVLVFFLNKK
jgi:hypothetical protein